MKYIYYLLSFLSIMAHARNNMHIIDSIQIRGYVGNKIDACIKQRVVAQDIQHLIEPFRHKEETRAWQSEFWGKWILGAIPLYQYSRDETLLNNINKAVEGLLETQLQNGYIGNYSEKAQLQQWDIWGRKYSLLGLLAYYDLTGNKKALTASKKLADHLIMQLETTGNNIIETGNFRGMASCSILEPIVLLYNRTSDKRYLDFASEIVRQWETVNGPNLISKASINVAERFQFPDSWWSWENGQKAYEMMSCYVGLLELYKVTGNPSYLNAVIQTADNIMNTEINIAGSGSSFECWYNGKSKQTVPTYHTMETCVTFTWMQLCHRLLCVTGDSRYADEIEKTTYNALMASMKCDASDIAKYSPLEGYRFAGENQCGMQINCCNANGPRAFALLPEFTYLTTDSCIYVNLYSPSVTTLRLKNKQRIHLKQTTNYPVDNSIDIEVSPEKELSLPIALRIPEWSKIVCLKINNEEITDSIKSGEYFIVNRQWKQGDRISLELDMRARIAEQNNSQAIVRGPIVLARDSRFGDGDIDESSILLQNGGYIELRTVTDPSNFAWMTFMAPAALGPEVEESDAPVWIKVCDFSSAGNDWDKTQRYRVWLPKTLNAMRKSYVSY